jgi:hypothetical protein
MNTVPRDIVIETWERQCALEQEESRSLVAGFLEEQPALGIWLLGCDEQLEEEAADSQLIPLATLAWESLTRTRGRRLRAVRPKVIDRAETANTRMLERLDEASEFDFRNATENLARNYNQRDLLLFCLEILMADHEEMPELAPDRIGLELLWIKTLIDCLDQ